MLNDPVPGASRHTLYSFSGKDYSTGVSITTLLLYLVSEWFASCLAIKLGLSSVQYEIVDETTIRSKNFAKGLIYEPISSLVDDDDTFERVYEVIKPFGEEFLFSYLTLMWFDCLIHNVDRHTENMGFLREPKSGKVISFAPNYDNNMCLFASSSLHMERKKDGLISLFRKFLMNNEESKGLYSRLPLPDFDETFIREILKDNPFKVDEEKLIAYLLEGKNTLSSFC